MNTRMFHDECRACRFFARNPTSRKAYCSAPSQKTGQALMRVLRGVAYRRCRSFVRRSDRAT